MDAANEKIFSLALWNNRVFMPILLGTTSSTSMKHHARRSPIEQRFASDPFRLTKIARASVIIITGGVIS